MAPDTDEHWSFWRFIQEDRRLAEGMNRWRYLRGIWTRWKIFDDLQHNRY